MAKQPRGHAAVALRADAAERLLDLIAKQHTGRHGVGDLQRLPQIRLALPDEAAEQRAHVEHERLQVEKRAQATPARVEKLAREQLHMRPATPAITQYVTNQGVGQQGGAP